jgi:hypothetical protein
MSTLCEDAERILRENTGVVVSILLSNNYNTLDFNVLRATVFAHAAKSSDDTLKQLICAVKAEANQTSLATMGQIFCRLCTMFPVHLSMCMVEAGRPENFMPVGLAVACGLRVSTQSGCAKATLDFADRHKLKSIGSPLEDSMAAGATIPTGVKWYDIDKHTKKTVKKGTREFEVLEFPSSAAPTNIKLTYIDGKVKPATLKGHVLVLE